MKKLIEDSAVSPNVCISLLPWFSVVLVQRSKSYIVDYVQNQLDVCGGIAPGCQKRFDFLVLGICNHRMKIAACCADELKLTGMCLHRSCSSYLQTSQVAEFAAITSSVSTCSIRQSMGRGKPHC